MDILKAFALKGRYLPFISVPALLEYLRPGRDDLVISERRLMDLYGGELKSARVLCRDAYGGGPNTVSLIERLCGDAGADYGRVVGLGGGGVLELAKLFALNAALPVSGLFEGRELRKARRLVLVPTTPGTGAEATPYAAILFEREGVQRILSDPALAADEVLLCPRFLKGIPFRVLAAGSFVSFVHACEGYTSPLATAITRALAEKALRELVRIWKQVAALGVGSLEDEYEHLQNAGSLAGIVCGNAGGAAVPALAYPLCVRHGVPHGEACYSVFFRIFSTYLSKSHSRALEELMLILGDALRCRPENALERLERLCSSVIEHKRLGEYGMHEGQIIEYTDMVLTRRHMLLANSSDQLTPAEIARIYRELL